MTLITVPLSARPAGAGRGNKFGASSSMNQVVIKVGSTLSGTTNKKRKGNIAAPRLIEREEVKPRSVISQP